MFNFASALVTLALAQTALAGIYITSPVASTNATGGQVLTVKWADNGQSPSIADIGVSSIDLYTGSVNQQAFLQNLAASVDVSKTSEISTTIDPSVGENGLYYFVRFRSANLKDATNPQYNYQAYSAKFEIDHMSGKFSAAVLAQINANATTASSTAAAVASAASASVVASSKAPVSASTAKASAAAVKPSNGAGAGYVAPGSAVLAFVGVASYLVL